MRPTTNVLSGLLAGLVLLAAGCTIHKDVQYFSVVDEQGNQNYYRVTVEGTSAGTIYSMQAGHFSAAAVDVIRGDMPEIPEIDLSIENERVLDETVSMYHQRLLTQGYNMMPPVPARARWIAVAQQVDKARRSILAAEAAIKEIEDQQVALKRADDKLEELIAAKALAVQDVEEKEDLVAAAETEVTAKTAELSAAQAQLDAITDPDADRTEAQAAVDRAKGELATAETNRNVETEKFNKATAKVNGIESERLAAVTKRDAELAKDEVLRVQFGPAQQERAEQLSRYAQYQADLARIAGTTAANEHPTEGSEDADPTDASGDAATPDPDATASTPDPDATASTPDPDATASTPEPDETASTPESTSSTALSPAERRPPERGAKGEVLEFGDGPGTIDAKLVELSRLTWYASLSTADLVAMGQAGNSNPFEFRKRVIWVSANNIDLQGIAGEIDSAIGSVLTIARSAKQHAIQRAQQRKAKRALVNSVLKRALPQLGVSGQQLADVLFPEASEGPGAGTDPLGELNDLRNEVGRERNDQ